MPYKNGIVSYERPYYHTYMRHPKKVSDKVEVVRLMDMPNGGASDVTLKKQVTEFSSVLERVLALRPVTWYWKADANNQRLQYGFIAQEVEKVFPDLVELKEDADGVSQKHLLTKGLIPYLLKALGEQQAQIDTLNSKIDVIESRNDRV